MSTSRGSGNWRGEDFIDPDAFSQPLVEADPWNPAVSGGIGDVPRPIAGQQPFEDTDYAGGEGSHWDLAQEIEPAPSFTDDPELVSNGGLWDGRDWDEPEPILEPDSELRETLYPLDTSVTDISLPLKIGEMLLRVTAMDDKQRARCTRLLKEYGVARLRHLLPWLRQREWCGASLQLFLSFRRLWESRRNVHWWETFQWSGWQQRWMPQYQRGTLTFDHAYELVRNRPHRMAEDVIDESWFEDWEDFAVWELGVRSFASFAVLRAGLAADQDWRTYLIREDRRSMAEVAECADRTFAPFMLPSIADQYGCSKDISGHGDSLRGYRHRSVRGEVTTSLLAYLVEGGKIEGIPFGVSGGQYELETVTACLDVGSEKS